MKIDLMYILKNSAGNLYWKDLQGQYLGANKTFIDLMYSKIHENFLGKTDREIFSKVMTDQKLKIIEETDQRIMQSGKDEFIREEGVDILGKRAFYLTKKSPLRDQKNKIIGIIGTSLDITNEIEAKNRAKLAEDIALMAKTKAAAEEEMRKTVMVLVGDIVHDLRTPIATIRTTADLLADIFPTVLAIIEEAQILENKNAHLLSKREMKVLQNNTLLNSLINSVKRIDEFINASLKELSNAEKAQQNELTQEDLTRCSSRRILENTLEAFPLENHIQLTVNIEYDFNLMGNSILIMKILFNLLRNAVEQITYLGKGEIFLRTEEGNTHNLIRIKDTAGGVEPHVEAQLFSKFFTTKKEGTGIGLAFCKNTMQSFGGDLTFNNQYGDFIEFILSFPK